MKIYHWKNQLIQYLRQNIKINQILNLTKLIIIIITIIIIIITITITITIIIIINYLLIGSIIN